MLNRRLGGILVTFLISFPVNAEFISTGTAIDTDNGKKFSNLGNNMIIDSDGTRYQRYGNILKDSNGYSWQIFGQIIRRSDGKSCLLFSNSINCSSADPINSP